MHLDAIGIVCKDITRSIEFYELLGMSFPEYKGEDHIEFQLESGLRVMLDTEDLMRKLNPDWKMPSGQGIVLAVKCDSPSDVDSTFEKILSKGFKGKKEPWDAFWGQRYASVIDPDGNAVDLFAEKKL